MPGQNPGGGREVNARGIAGAGVAHSCAGTVVSTRGGAAQRSAGPSIAFTAAISAGATNGLVR